MHNQKDRPMTMNDRVALARHKRIKSGDIWPGDFPGFDGSVRHDDDCCTTSIVLPPRPSVRHDATPEYVGSRAKKRILCVGYARDGVIEIRS